MENKVNKTDELLQAILDSNLRLEASGAARQEKIDAVIEQLMPMLARAFKNLEPNPFFEFPPEVKSSGR